MHIQDLKPYYDVIIIGSGAGGGTLAYKLCSYGIKVLLVERGKFIPVEKENWSNEAYLGKKYETLPRESMRIDSVPEASRSFVGGQTKLFGAALYRFRERDFDEVVHEAGVSPAWPIRYDELEPYYCEAELLYKVHGAAGVDFTEPHHSQAYAREPLPHDKNTLPLLSKLAKQRLTISHIPRAVNYHQSGGCTLCNTCDGFACRQEAKMDAEFTCLKPALNSGYLDLVAETECLRINCNESGSEVSEVELMQHGLSRSISANIYVSSCGGFNSPILFIKSASEKHPNGLANSSGQVGRNLNGHNSAILISPTFKYLDNDHHKTFAINDYYFGSKTYPYPLGILQAAGRMPAWNDMPQPAKTFVKFIMQRSILSLVMGETIPNSKNRIYFAEGKFKVNYSQSNLKSFDVLQKTFIGHYRKAGYKATFSTGQLAGASPWAPVGTMRFGENPKESVLDTYCKTYDIDNLYVVDSSFMPSSGSVNASLSIMAQALRVGEHIAGRLGAQTIKDIVADTSRIDACEL